MPVTLKFNKFPNKSISFPCRSHPSTFQIEEMLNKIKSSSSTTIRSADNICSDLSQLVEVYDLVNHLLILPGTQNLISSHSNSFWIHDVMNRSLTLLDICSNLRDLVLQMQEHVQDLQCVLRRRTDRITIETSAAKYNSFRKKTKKDVREFVISLKQSEKVMGLVVDSNNHHFTAVIRVLMEVSDVTIPLFESVMIYISAGPALQVSRWPLVVSKLLMHKGSRVVDNGGGSMNDFEALDVLLVKVLRNGRDDMPEIMQIVQHRLEGMHNRMQGIESGLTCMFRILVKQGLLYLILCL